MGSLQHDVCIVGAGPAGLNAALVLGRCGRDVIVFDSGQPRNAVSRGLHGFLTRDGVHPQDLRLIGRRELAAYPSVRVVDQPVASAQRRREGFEVATADGRITHSTLLLLATGRIDVLPDLPGFREFYGRGVYHCPYCDGWGHRGRQILVYGDGPGVVEFALELLTWSRDVTLCPPAAGQHTGRDLDTLRANGIRVPDAPLVALAAGPEGALAVARLADGTSLPCDAVFFISELPQKSLLAQSLGCRLDAAGSVVCTQHAATGVPGLYVAGNVRGGIHLAIMAAAEGAEAAVAMNTALAERELRRPAGGATAKPGPAGRIPSK